MLFLTTLKVALRSLLSNKLRSILSMLGIIIGVGAVIAMLAVGRGAQNQVLSQVTALGSNLIMVMPGQFRAGGVRSATAQTLLLDDARAVLEEIPEVVLASPVARGNVQFKYFGENKQASIMGVATTYPAIRNFKLADGRMFTEGEIERRAKVAVLGADLAVDLYGEDPDPVDTEVRLNGVVFAVVGVLERKGAQGPFSFDDQALVPYTTAMNRILGADYINEIDLQVGDGVDLESVQARIEQLLRRRHKLRDDEDNDFHVANMAEMVEAAQSVTGVFTLLLSAVAAISLVVGGIGIMNIMLVTVTERTREIGIRKAIGAKDRDILVQFLLEAIVMSTLGGLIGILAGVSTAKAGTMITGFPTVVSSVSIALALTFSLSVGIFFGFYPARRAAAMDPVEALSYE